MDKEHVKGAMDKAKGQVKESVGKATGNKEMEGQGKIDQAKGKVREVAGDGKDAVRRATANLDD